MFWEISISWVLGNDSNALVHERVFGEKIDDKSEQQEIG